ncbi:hypothetical protein Y032_1013g3393 [Ancylostoma ceylanicum]|uniref:Reverse transcriptase domain-containing protein n=1 Tax=Ancylostoma ceylanicum TaxID=53326 RepID=A0A016W9F0_9BILA|nr:hypothetical protein Y032_1013g3393 [Ancylostoma ceylanicum]
MVVEEKKEPGKSSKDDGMVDEKGTIVDKNVDLPIDNETAVKIRGKDVDVNELRRTDYFKYLGSTLSADGSLDHEVVAHINAAWMKWRAMTRVLCDKKIPDRFKSKVYRAVVRSVALYGAECWPATKRRERRLSVMETKMFRWTAGITRADRIRKEKIRVRFGIAPIADKLRESCPRWYGHFLRAKP